MKLQQIFAHAGEQHSDSADSVTHYAGPWYVTVPIILAAATVVVYFAWLLSGRKTIVLQLVVALMLLISGFLLFDFSVAVSVIAITGGIILGGILALGALVNDDGLEK